MEGKVIIKIIIKKMNWVDIEKLETTFQFQFAMIV